MVSSLKIQSPCLSSSKEWDNKHITEENNLIRSGKKWVEDLNHANREEKIYFSNKMIHVSIFFYLWWTVYYLTCISLCQIIIDNISHFEFLQNNCNWYTYCKRELSYDYVTKFPKLSSFIKLESTSQKVRTEKQGEKEEEKFIAIWTLKFYNEGLTNSTYCCSHRCKLPVACHWTRRLGGGRNSLPHTCSPARKA